MTINEAMRALCDELAAGDVPAPLHQPLTLGLVWADLCRLVGEEPPADVPTRLTGDDTPWPAQRKTRHRKIGCVFGALAQLPCTGLEVREKWGPTTENCR